MRGAGSGRSGRDVLVIGSDTGVEVQVPLAAHRAPALGVGALVDVVFGPAEAGEIFPTSLGGGHVCCGSCIELSDGCRR